MSTTFVVYNQSSLVDRPFSVCSMLNHIRSALQRLVARRCCFLLGLASSVRAVLDLVATWGSASTHNQVTRLAAAALSQ